MAAVRSRTALLLLALVLVLGGAGLWVALGTRENAFTPAEDAPKRATTARELADQPPSPALPAERSHEELVPAATVPDPTLPGSTQHGEGSTPPNSAALLAHLVDDELRPTPNASYVVYPADRGGAPAARRAWLEGTSDENGRVKLMDLAPGRWIAVFAPTYRAPKRFEVTLAPGWNDLGPIAFPSLGDVADLRVRLGGPGWTGSTGGALHLRSLWGDDVDRWNRIGRGPWMRELTEDEARATFQGLPHGRYELSFFREDLQDDAQVVQVDVPGDEVVFEIAAHTDVLTVRLEDESGATLDGGTLLCVPADGSRVWARSVDGESEVAGLPPGTWMLIACAPDFAAVSIDAARLPRGPSGPRGSAASITIPMRRGRSMVVFARDEQRWLDVPGVGLELAIGREHAPPLAGIDVSVDGRTLGQTDMRGLAIVDLPRADALIELGSASHVLVDATNFEGQQVVDAAQLVVARFVRR